jgi:hypothetical protein
MKIIIKITFLFLGLLVLLSCAKPNEPAAVEGNLNIEHKFTISGYARDISVSDSHLYIAEDQAGYTIYDLNTNGLISHHESFIMETDPVMFENVRAITAVEDENLLFVYDLYGTNAIYPFDMTDKVNPSALVPIFGQTSNIVQLDSDISPIGGADLYWTNGSVYSFGRFDESWYPNIYMFHNSVAGFDIVGNNIFIAAEQLGFHIVNKNNGTIISTTDTEAEALDVKIVDNYAIVALRQAGFAVYDVSNTSAPTLVCQKETNEYIYTIDVEGNHLVLGSHNGGVYLYDISDVTEPVLTGNLNSDKIGYTYKSMIKNGKIYAATRNGVYEIGME